MPGFDGTGPRGLGPMTGGGRGYCMLKVSSCVSDFVRGFTGLPGKPFFTGRSATMPRGDGTGPMGAGPMTGRGAGFCAGFNRPGFANRPGFGRMGGGGRGWRHWFHATGLPGWARANAAGFGRLGAAAPTAEDERAELEQECSQVEEYLKQLRRRVDELKAQPGK